METKVASKVKAGTLAGMGVTVVWGALKTFYPDVQFDPMLISGSTTFVSALVAYYKVEKVLLYR